MSSAAEMTRLVLPQDPSPTAVPADSALPLRITDFDAGVVALYHAALGGKPAADVLTGLCQHLSRLLKLRLAVLVRRLDTGATAIEATSRENSLWLELQRIPERWDSGLSSHGPAGECLRTGTPIGMGVDGEGFALWRAGARAEQVRQVLALPIPADDGIRVLEMFFDGHIAQGATAGTMTIDALARKVSALLADLRTIEQRHLLARALACAGNGAFITDLEGTIVWSNDAFSVLSGYSADDVRGRNPSLLRSGQQGVRYYRDLWGTIRAGKIWSGETMDRGKDGKLYTIQQTVSPVSQDGRITHYLSIHQDIGRQKHAQVQLELASRLSPATGLLTHAAFESAAHEAIAAAANRVLALVVVSLRGAQRAAGAMDRDMEDFMSTVLGTRVREGVPALDLAGTLGPFEYVLLLGGEDLNEAVIQERLGALAERLNEPIPHLGNAPELDAHFGMALFPRDGATFHSLRLKADRQLANEPYRRARRKAPN